uniref:Uncharacterized protein n=1 Tax=Strigamia maritima TaxID=126957 RepID=T1J3G1_STRMM
MSLLVRKGSMLHRASSARRYSRKYSTASRDRERASSLVPLHKPNATSVSPRTSNRPSVSSVTTTSTTLTPPDADSRRSSNTVSQPCCQSVSKATTVCFIIPTTLKVMSGCYHGNMYSLVEVILEKWKPQGRIFAFPGYNFTMRCKIDENLLAGFKVEISNLIDRHLPSVARSSISIDDRKHLYDDVETGGAVHGANYGSIVYQMRDANEEASGCVDFVGRALGILFNTVFFTGLLLLLAVMPILMVVMETRAESKNHCFIGQKCASKLG